jgi:hypothetical protein
METAYISAIAALGGSAIGGLTSLMASWVTHHVQFVEKDRTASQERRVTLYRAFIGEASKVYADAHQHQEADLLMLVNLYALVNEMRILSSSPVIASADGTMRAIIETYLAPNKTFREIAQTLDHESTSPLRDFSTACREELQRRDFA